MRHVRGGPGAAADADGSEAGVPRAGRLHRRRHGHPLQLPRRLRLDHGRGHSPVQGAATRVRAQEQLDDTVSVGDGCYVDL